MGQALYRDYRPKSFDDVVGQDHITTTLKKAIKSGRINHAYLFTGPKGVGKTSIARILAHEVNGLPYDDESIHLDIIEIDAASNNGVEDVRELRDKVNISPTSAKYKIYIIDEVHMLSKAAFNALLKTLEEPPAHAIFILATTEAHKLPETIISRTQRFEFKPIARNYATDHLANIAKSEKIKIDDRALELLAEHGEGSFRDSISLLDQLSASDEKIDEATVREFLGLPPAKLVQELAETVSLSNAALALERLDTLREQGANPSLVASLLAKEIRQQLFKGNDPRLTNLLRQLIEVPASYRPADSLEIAVLEACSLMTAQPAQTVAAAIVSEPVIMAKPAPTEKPEAEEAPKAEQKPAEKKHLKQVPHEAVPFDDKAWEEIIEQVKDQAASLYTALRLATPEVSGGKLTLAFQFPLHQKKVNEAKHKDLIGQIVAHVTGQNLAIDSVVDKSKKPQAKEPPKEKVVIKKPIDSESLGSISNIFGQAEVIES